MKDGGPAFPATRYTEPSPHSTGMSLRDYFAAHAPAEYLAVVAKEIQAAGNNETPVATIMAVAAFLYADAMLAERDK